MQRRRWWLYTRIVVIAALTTVSGGFATVAAESSNSANYQATDLQFNSGTLEGCSAQYCAKASIGDIAAGETKAPASTANFGSETSSEPLLEVIVDTGESNLGILDTEHTATKTSVVRIRSYLSDGYTLQITGTPPKYGAHTMATPGSPTASTPGKEQFGINVVANTSPSLGADPVQVPSSEFSFGEVTDDYKTPNRFKYVSGDVVARSTKASGQTDYTVSMIVNISNTTPAGRFTGDYSAVVIPLY